MITIKLISDFSQEIKKKTIGLNSGLVNKLFRTSSFQIPNFSKTDLMLYSCLLFQPLRKCSQKILITTYEQLRI